MNDRITEDVKRYAKEVLEMDLVGIAPIERYADAPPEFHPQQFIPDAKAVITMGLVHNPDMVQESHINKAKSVVEIHGMNTENLRAGYKMSRYIQKKWGYRSGATGLPVHLPEAFVKAGLQDIKGALKPAVYFSVKMAAVHGGLGKRGVNDLLIHPEHGSIVRLVSVVTQAPLTGDPLSDFDPICDTCDKPCMRECPTGAVSVKQGDPYTKGSIDWQKCFNLLGNEALMLGYAACLQCASVCPHSKQVS